AAYHYQPEGYLGQWLHVELKITPSLLQVYVNGELTAENTSPSASMAELGANLTSYLGKSYYSADKFCKAYYDNIEIYSEGMVD
ncbi:MAG: LamG-like jellyroll fold domain-containing protein, partial [Clostridia bacterium]